MELVSSMEDIRPELNRLAAAFTQQAIADECNRLRKEFQSESVPEVSRAVVGQILGGRNGQNVRYQTVFHVYRTLCAMRQPRDAALPLSKVCIKNVRWIRPDWTLGHLADHMRRNRFSYAPYRTDKPASYNRLVSRDRVMEALEAHGRKTQVKTVLDDVLGGNASVQNATTPVRDIWNLRGRVDLFIVEEFRGRPIGIIAPYDLMGISAG